MTGITPHQAKAELARRRTRQDFDRFFKTFPPGKPYEIGEHTEALISTLQHASDSVLRGETTHKIIVMPPRHGKSDCASRRFPAWHLCRAPSHEVILASYSQGLSRDLAYSARNSYRDIAPEYGLGIDKNRSKLEAWRTTEGGWMYAVGLGGTITGRGANILIIDDYLKNREEAESARVRQKIWRSFQNDLMTRLAPNSAVVVVCTRWHEDDLVGRILEAQEEEHDFPNFELIRFPAWHEDRGWLFPERFSDSYYRQKRATVGSYAWQALYQGDPRPREGNLLMADNVRFAEEAPNIPMTRAWDLASTAEERTGDDPDYTVGTKGGYDAAGNLWVVDVVRGRWSAPQRDRMIRQTAREDGQGVRQRIESVAAQKDTTERIRVELGGGHSVQAEYPSNDKVARASPLEPLFENGRVIVVKGEWNDPWMTEIQAFPNARHDDQVDSLVAMEKDRRPDSGADAEVW